MMSFHRKFNNKQQAQQAQQDPGCQYCYIDNDAYLSGDSDDSYDCVTSLPATAIPQTSKSNPQTQTPCFDPNDPLRYCVKTCLISKDEYEKWKIVKQSAAVAPTKTKPCVIDFGAGYNSESGTDDECDISDHCQPDVIYGSGYTTQFPSRRIQPGGAWVEDPWFPNPDPTSNKQYTDLGRNLHIMMSQFVVFEKNGDMSVDGLGFSFSYRLNHAFNLKLMWEQFNSNCNVARHQPLQNFWETKSLEIYEALQDLTATHAKCFNTGAHRLIHDTPEFHTTPLETLDHTFETIGRMCRCIGDDFNTQHVVNYVDEFIHALYTELRFMDLVEAKVEDLIDVEYDERAENNE
jgi:hypothetical protein